MQTHRNAAHTLAGTDSAFLCTSKKYFYLLLPVWEKKFVYFPSSHKLWSGAAVARACFWPHCYMQQEFHWSQLLQIDVTWVKSVGQCFRPREDALITPIGHSSFGVFEECLCKPLWRAWVPGCCWHVLLHHFCWRAHLGETARQHFCSQIISSLLEQIPGNAGFPNIKQASGKCIRSAFDSRQGSCKSHFQKFLLPSKHTFVAPHLWARIWSILNDLMSLN